LKDIGKDLLIMINHYLVVCWRNIVRKKFYSIILVSGLALGISTALLLGLYARYELSYDSFHENHDRIFLVGVDQKEGSEESKSGWTTPPTGPALKEYFAEVEAMTRLCFWFDDVMVTGNNIQLPEKELIAADSSIFDVFTIPFLAGDPKTALTEPNTVVITQAAAKKYFKGQNPIGQTLQFEHFFHECKVTGVVQDYPENSHFDFEIILSLSSLKTIHFDFDNSWENHTFSTYLLFHRNAEVHNVSDKLGDFVKATLDPYLVRRYDRTLEQMQSAGNHYKLFLTPLADVHLSTLIFENREGKKLLTYALVCLAVAIIVLVCINYNNLASVLAFSRNKEAAVRKIAGSGKASLFIQFTLESVFIALVGLIVSLGIVEVALPSFNNLTGQELSVDYTDPKLIIALVGFTVVVGMISGVYPAASLASGTPIEGLRSKQSRQSYRSAVRNLFVIFQFSICMVMIVSTIIVYKQLHFMMNKDAGFAMDQVLVINRPSGLGNNKIAFKNELLKNNFVEAVSFSGTTPGRHFNGHGQHFKGRAPEVSETVFPMLADEDIFKALDLEIVIGHDFVTDPRSGPKAIVNQSAVGKLLLDKPLEQIIDAGTMGKGDIPIVGVVKDFHFKSFHHSIEPLVFYVIDPSKGNDALPQIEATWKSLSGNYPFEYSFLDKDFQALFAREYITAKVYTVFCCISILIACLGLLGLASFFVERRTKEIGIRKIVGATGANIVILLSRDFGKLIVTSILLGSLVSWLLMSQWLANFAYQTDMAWWIFASSGGAIALLAVITVGWHLTVAASRNPVETLRYE
jgi:putative ABC transport system permease protein